MSDDVSEQSEDLTAQAADAGNVEVIPKTEAVKEADEGTAPEKTPKEERIEEKKSQKSQTEWQEKTEKVNEYEAFKQKLAEDLGLKPEEVEEDFKDVILKKVSSLEQDVNRKDWEVDHAIVRTDKYKEEWAKVNSDPKYASLSYDERWKLIKDETKSKTEEDIRTYDEGSVPSLSKTEVSSSDEIPAEEMSYYRSRNPGKTDAEIRKMLV